MLLHPSSTLPIDADRLMQIDRLLSYEDTLDAIYHSLERLRSKMSDNNLDLYRNIQYELSKAIVFVNQAHEIVYKHNINLNLTYEKHE